MLLLLIGLFIFQLDLVKSDLQIIIDNIELKTAEEYFEQCSATPCENDDMVAIFSLDCKIKKTLPLEGSLKAVLLQMVNGEPTEPTGVDMELTVDQMMKDTVLIIPLFNAMKIPLVWPLQAVHMKVDCYVPPMENFPDFFPPGEYKFSFDITHEDLLLFSLGVYVSLF